MAQFNESKHPRDEEGKFTNKDCSVEYRQNTSYKDILSSNKLKVKSSDMTKQEWALWYKAVADNKKLGYWAEELPNGDALLRVETNSSSKLVVTSGTFERPKAKTIFEFDNADDLIYFIAKLKE